jgi:hypothetical protein
LLVSEFAADLQIFEAHLAPGTVLGNVYAANQTDITR